MIKTVVIINDYAEIQGGAAKVAIESAVSLAKRGYKVIFIYAAGEIDQCLYSSTVNCIGLEQHDLLSGNKFKSFLDGLWNFEVERKVYKILQNLDSQSTVVHVHSWVKSLSISIFKPIRQSNIKCVVTLHDFFSVCPNGGFFNYQKQKICKLKPMSYKCLFSNCDSRAYSYKLWRYTRQAIYSIAKFPSDLISYIYVSEFSKEKLIDYFPDESKFFYVQNPIDVKRKDFIDPSKSKKILFIGRLSPEKGVRLLCDLGESLHENMVIVGSGPLSNYLREKMKKTCFKGWRAREEIFEILEDARMLVFPSELYETQGMVVKEAAAYGIPAIVSDETAAKEMIVDGENGVLFKSGNSLDLKNKINSLMEDDELVRSLGEMAYKEFWENPTDIKKHTDELISCYENILNN